MKRLVLTGWLSMVLVILLPPPAMPATTVFQQGLDGYSGCKDTMIATGGYYDNESQNFGQCTELRANCDHYAYW